MVLALSTAVNNDDDVDVDADVGGVLKESLR